MWGTVYNLLMGDATPEERTRVWRIVISSALTFHIILACGLIPGISPGFASVESVTKLQETIDAIQIKQLLEAIEKERRNACLNLVQGNTAALEYAVRKRDELLREYRQVTGQEAHFVGCEELGIRIDSNRDPAS